MSHSQIANALVAPSVADGEFAIGAGVEVGVGVEDEADDDAADRDGASASDLAASAPAPVFTDAEEVDEERYTVTFAELLKKPAKDSVRMTPARSSAMLAPCSFAGSGVSSGSADGACAMKKRRCDVRWSAPDVCVGDLFGLRRQ